MQDEEKKEQQEKKPDEITDAMKFGLIQYNAPHVMLINVTVSGYQQQQDGTLTHKNISQEYNLTVTCRNKIGGEEVVAMFAQFLEEKRDRFGGKLNVGKGM